MNEYKGRTDKLKLLQLKTEKNNEKKWTEPKGLMGYYQAD